MRYQSHNAFVYVTSNERNYDLKEKGRSDIIFYSNLPSGSL